MLEITNKTQQKINKKTAIAVADGLLDFYKKNNQEVSLVIIGDKKMQSLNCVFRGIDKTTDVLSFSSQLSDFQKITKDKHPRKPLIAKSVPLAPTFLGEIFINIQEAERVKKYQEIFGPENKKSRDYIFYFLLVHGLLHLLGYDDKTEKTRTAMITLGETYLSGFFKKKVV
jgi:probable rRNA maturation factor